mgnify:FL=1|jgi:hypothetical protein|tara:strand:- start:934 stop:1218 length:285 start_codon:yes stop_codon:yes gene_type:complete
MKNVTCLNCQNFGSVGTMEDTIHNSMVEEMGSEYGEMIELAFRQRGVVEGIPFWVCNKCESGLIINTFGDPELVVGKRLKEMKEQWESGTGEKF